MDNLFDVFDEAPQSGGDKSQSTGKKRVRANGDSSTSNGNSASLEKRQRRDEPGADNDDDNSQHADADSESEHGNEDEVDAVSKRAANEPEPRVADTFETQESREVAASAGLQAQKEDENVVLQHQVRHQVALPAEYDYVPLSQHVPPKEPARTWPFTLDPFQQVSISSIQRNESVLVSAHTSAGKTVVAEYAIAQCLKNTQRVIYTSPIKALSNQKYREFLALFGDVGLMTGDVTINPGATCLVMTTEILRSMLYRGSEIMREVAWVVFDEVHYLRDKSRGVVWEETIILLPDKVRYVFLSATIPNAMQFAEWITKTHNQPCHVVYTDFRPTPLQHYLFPSGSDGIHLVVDEKGVFREENFGRAMASISDKHGDDPSDPNARQKGKGKNKKFNKGGQNQKDGASDIYKIVKMIMMKNYNPVIVFSFSKRECEALALQMSQLSFNDETEKEMVSKVFEGAIDTLSEDDKQLPQIKNMLPLLIRGVGIHHSGLLPILKETIEILFQEGLLKALFATETFSIGLNMPAKTVVFTNVRKFDGVSTRWVSPSEFIQMSGRAGRRGIDDRGIVIMMIDERMEPNVAKEIVRGEQDKLNSAFHLSYNMVLNLMRVEGISPDYMLERCFFQFQSIASVSGLERQFHDVEAEKANLRVSDEATIKEYYDIRQGIETYAKDMKEVITHPSYSLSFMQPGRVVRVRYQSYDFGWGVVVQYKKRIIPRHKMNDIRPQEQYSVDVCLNLAVGTQARILNPELPDGVRPPAHGEKTEMQVVDVLLSCVDQIGGVRIFMPDKINGQKDLAAVRQNLEECKRRFPGGVSLLDPVENMGIKSDSFKKLIKKISVLEQRLEGNPLHQSPRLPELYNQYSRKVELQNQAKAIKKQINEALSITQAEELKCRKRVLRRLGFINDDDVVQLKARVACEISTGDELVLSELLFNRFFNELTPEQCAAALSCFVFEEKNDATVKKPELQKAYAEIQKQARIVAKVSQESKLPVKEDDYLATFNPGLMEVVHEWTKGKTFAEICKMSTTYEGSLIRVFRRLEELLRQMGMATRVMGNDEAFGKFEQALGMLQRDIVAAQSLYL